ncbi:hypothetical protein ACFSC3_12830 [Sphingomonas floccifaciens]|uniref:Uncharacterized protein n=1 Tax=Sphingomonas floccifaciens TaxID=1844115 RepID=A0ABW4NEV0_9SPHN
MMYRSIFAATALMTLAVTPANAAPCRGSKGKFVKCPDAAPAKPVNCKDAKGKFAKCGTTGAKPVR